MKVAISYADEVYAHAQKLNTKMAYKRGKFDKVIAYSKESLEPEFIEKNERFFKYKRGGGYWIWKSHIIQKTLRELDYGDYLLYSDSGTAIIRPIDLLIKVMEQNNEDIMLFEVYDRLEKEWTKRDVFIALDYDTPECAETNQIMSTFILIKKTKRMVNFIDEFVNYSQTGMIITDEPNEYGKDNYESFCENRHDQSVLSVLAKKYGIIAYRDPSNWGWHQKIHYRHKCMGSERDYYIYDRSKFPTIFFHHRYKVINLRNMLAAIYHILKKHYEIQKDSTKRI